MLWIALHFPRLPLEAFMEKIDDRTRVVATAWVTYRNGYRVDLPALGERHPRRKRRVDGLVKAEEHERRHAHVEQPSMAPPHTHLPTSWPTCARASSAS